MNKMKKKIVSTGDFTLAVAEGNAFFDVACWCEHKNLDLDMVSPYLFPFAVNMSFAIETYMKAIMIYYSEKNEFAEGHDLEMLFGELPEHVKEHIDKAFDERKVIHGLGETLRRNKHTFQDWRYGFQNTGRDLEIHSSDIGRLANCLKNYCNSLVEEIEKGTNSDL